MINRGPGKNLKGEDDETVTGQNRKRFGKGAVNRRLAAPEGGIVETGKVVISAKGNMRLEVANRIERAASEGLLTPTSLRPRQITEMYKTKVFF